MFFPLSFSARPTNKHSHKPTGAIFFCNFKKKEFLKPLSRDDWVLHAKKYDEYVVEAKKKRERLKTSLLCKTEVRKSKHDWWDLPD